MIPGARGNDVTVSSPRQNRHSSESRNLIALFRRRRRKGRSQPSLTVGGDPYQSIQTNVPAPRFVKASISIACGTWPSRTTAASTPPSTAWTQV
jgi:hypothetical protein